MEKIISTTDSVKSLNLNKEEELFVGTMLVACKAKSYRDDLSYVGSGIRFGYPSGDVAGKTVFSNGDLCLIETDSMYSAYWIVRDSGRATKPLSYAMLNSNWVSDNDTLDNSRGSNKSLCFRLSRLLDTYKDTDGDLKKTLTFTKSC